LSTGADAYRNSKYKLNFAIADAKGFVDAITPAAEKLFRTVQVLTLYDSELTKSSLYAAFVDISKRAKPQDVFIFFYSGHGIAIQEEKKNVFYFVLPGVTVMNDPDKLKDQGMTASDVCNLIGSIAASKQMLLVDSQAGFIPRSLLRSSMQASYAILTAEVRGMNPVYNRYHAEPTYLAACCEVVDSCNSGAFLEGFAKRGAAEENALAQLQRSAGIALFSASTDDQFATEVSTLGHGIFTYALIQGLKGDAAAKDGRITVATLKSYIDDAVPILSARYHGSEQYPLARITGQDFPLGVRQ